MKKIVTDVTGGAPKVTTTDYIGSFVYKNDSLQYISHEEGRIRTSFKTGQPVAYNYDYFVKDHLGNIRLVLTDQTDLSMYTATMETTSAATETALFSNIDNTRVPKPVGYPSGQDTAKNQSVSKLTALKEGKKIGPSLVLRVMAGDTFRIKTNAFYKSTAPTEKKEDIPLPESMVPDLVQAFKGATEPGGTHGVSATNTSTPFGRDFYSTDYQRLKERDGDPVQVNRPKAYLNFVLFDDQFKLVEENSGVRQVKAEPDQLQLLGQDKMVVSKSGFLYIYTSNESPQDVFFDNVTVALASGPLLEETHYYPFGLQMAGISSNALKGTNYPANRKKYNGIEYTDDLDLDIYDAQLRNLDPQIGRWNQVDPKTEDMEMWSPYASNYDNPIRYQDFLGDEPDGDDPPTWRLYLASALGTLNGVEKMLGLPGVSSDKFPFSSQEKRIYDGASTTGTVVSAVLTMTSGGGANIPESPSLALAGGGKAPVGASSITGPAVPVPIVNAKAAKPVEIYIDGSRHPESAQHGDEAKKDKAVKVEGVVDRKGRDARRKENLEGVEIIPGKDRDEFPPAVIKTGGKVSVKHITSSDNRGAGASIGQQIRNLPDNTRVRIVIKHIPPNI